MSHPQLISEDTKRTSGENVRSYNLLAARMIKNLIEGSFGPYGKGKIYIDLIGEATFTKDGATFLRKIDVEHPAAKVLIDASNTVDNEVGDGTTSVVIIAASLLQKAEEMLLSSISPATISNGYDIGLGIALDILQNIAKEADNKDITILKKLAKTCLGTKIESAFSILPERSNIVEIVVNAVKTIYNNSNNYLDIDDIKIEEKIGNFVDSQLVEGILIDKALDNKTMPKFIENAKILLIDEDLETKRTRNDAEISISDPKKVHLFAKEENEMIKEKVQNIIDSNANVLISRKGIGSKAQDYLSRAGILSIKRVKENDLSWLEKATGAKITRDIQSKKLKESLGYAAIVYEKFVGDDKMVFIEGCKNPKAVTILLRANSKMLLDEYHRAVLSTITAIKNFISKPSIVIGGGACEAIIANEIRKKALEFSGREQIVLTKFAEAIEEIPLTIAKNAGMDVMDSFIELKTKLSKNIHNKKAEWYGINLIDRSIGELTWEIIEPLGVKEQVFNTAVEVSRLLINIDDVLVKKPLMNTHTHEDGTEHSHAGGDKKHDHYFDKLGKQQRPSHHYY